MTDIQAVLEQHIVDSLEDSMWYDFLEAHNKAAFFDGRKQAFIDAKRLCDSSSHWRGCVTTLQERLDGMVAKDKKDLNHRDRGYMDGLGVAIGILG